MSNSIDRNFDSLSSDAPLISHEGFFLVSNGSCYSVLTGRGAGYLAMGQTVLTPVSSLQVAAPSGCFLYLRDRENGAFWSVGRDPVAASPDSGSVTGEPGIVSFARSDDGIASRMEVWIDPGTSLELRRVTIENQSGRQRELELTSYAEVVLAGRDAHAAHPVFSRLFIQTAWIPGSRTLIARRRPRANGEVHPVLFHSLSGSGDLDYETSRYRFVGRGGSAAAPQALRSPMPLSRSVGAVLDPIVSLRRVIRVEDGQKFSCTFLTGTAPTSTNATETIEAFTDENAIECSQSKAKANASSMIAEAGLTVPEAGRLDALAARVLLGDSAPGPVSPPHVPGGGSIGPALGRYGVSVEKPFVVAESGGGPMREYWRKLGLPIDVVIPDEQVPEADAALLRAAACFVMSPALPVAASAARSFRGTVPPHELPERLPVEEELLFFNGCGGFADEGREYVIRIPYRAAGHALPPLPWVNIIANHQFGTMVSETGAGYTWCLNSREHRLTPWSNDPVRDPHGESLFLRDEETGALWSPLPGPLPGAGDYEMRHGFGYSTCHHRSNGLKIETRILVALDDPIKITRVTITNQSDRKRSLFLFSDVQLVLGNQLSGTGRFVRTDHDAESGITFGYNPTAGDEYASRVAFHAIATTHPSETGFESLSESRISHAASLSVEPGEDVECAFLLGEAESRDEAVALVARYRARGATHAAMEEVRAHWKEIHSTITVKTPVPAIDVMVNGWLLYQTIACRLHGRSAFYQSGGAFGFRDQLQDSAALVYALPAMTRDQILLHAGHQFIEGDVLHWWHPPHSKGIRTKFVDDLLWLPYVTSFYVRNSGDWNVLDEKVRYLSARLLEKEEDEAYVVPVDSGESGDLYEHCCRAIDRSLKTGEHGLPLFGAGDWNDGMNRVGRGGRGESVFMAFFLYRVLGEFIPLCESRSDDARIRAYQEHRKLLLTAVNEAGWDGEWYRRGYYDDGSPLGSRENQECRIDALAQAWAVISGAATKERAQISLASLEKHLISDSQKLIRLLTPPFQDTPHDPGYIKGYVAGVRENGGQYTHAALWVVRAFAEMGQNNRAAELLEMLSPVSHAMTPEAVATYQVEPYVVAADVYSEPPHVGRGGWTWYTGSASWMYRVAVESILGLSIKNGNTLLIKPCVPDDWPRYEIEYRLPDGRTRYRITIENPSGNAGRVLGATLDGEPTAVVKGTASVLLVADGSAHEVSVTLGR